MRTSIVERNTKETQIKVELCLDGGAVEVSTGIGFFDHMLTAFGVHGGFGLKVTVKGDLEVDTHHTVEDTGIALGMAFKQALGDMSGIERYGTFSFLWTKALFKPHSTFQTDRFLFSRLILSRRSAAITKIVAPRSFGAPLQ